MPMRALPALTCALLALFAVPALAVQDCEINGAHVNPANGNTTAGKSGIMKCRDRDTGKLVREEEYRNGRPVGYRKFIDFQGQTIVANYNENGNRDGESKTFDADGTLLAHERYVNGDTVGVQTFYYKSKQIKRLTYSERNRSDMATIEYNERGQLTELRCADRSVLEADRKLCGFDRAADVDFYNSKGDVVAQARYENGKRVAFKALGGAGVVARTEDVQGEKRIVRSNFPDGQLRLETTSVGNRKEHEREFAKSGQPVRETRWLDGRQSEETLWYLNGQMKSKTRWERDGKDVVIKADEFWDNGKLQSRTVRDERYRNLGVQQFFDEGGELISEQTYERGKLTRRRDYKAGRLVLDEQYYEDGSRK
jgi:antitoxin component YwqK of YwqJK toxin-antitoxin module